MMKKLLVLFPLFVFLFSCQTSDVSQKKSWTLAVGTYTDTLSKGIYLFEINLEDCSHTLKQVIESQNPSFLAYEQKGKFLYAVNELKQDATLQQFSFNNDALVLKKECKTMGAHPCHVSVDKYGKNVFVANYNGSNFVQFWANDSLTLVYDQKSMLSGPNQARQEKSHIHMVYLDENRQRLYVTDLGGDVTTVYPYLYAANHQILLDSTKKIELKAESGGGPRHLVTTKNGEYVFVVNELTAKVEHFKLHNLKYEKVGLYSLVADSTKSSSAADIHLSDDEKFLYVSNRGETNELIVFDVSEIEKPKKIQHISTGGKTPRNFTLSPDGRWLFVANQNSHEVVIFEREPSTGLLKATNRKIDVGMPTCLTWLMD